MVSDTWEVCKNWKLEDTRHFGGKVSDLGNRDRRPRREKEGTGGDAEDLSQGSRENDIN